jgi:hypothetical protein
MATAKQSYIDLELDWLEARAKEIKDYVDKRPLEGLVERVIYKTVKGGGQIPIIAATIEQQITSHRAMLMDYLKLTDAIAKAREAEDIKKKAVRGNQALSPLEEGVI